MDERMRLTTLVVGLAFWPAERNRIFAKLIESLSQPEHGQQPHPAPELAAKVYRVAFPVMVFFAW